MLDKVKPFSASLLVFSLTSRFWCPSSLNNDHIFKLARGVTPLSNRLPHILQDCRLIHLHYCNSEFSTILFSSINTFSKMAMTPYKPRDNRRQYTVQTTRESGEPSQRSSHQSGFYEAQLQEQLVQLAKFEVKQRTQNIQHQEDNHQLVRRLAEKNLSKSDHSHPKNRCTWTNGIKDAAPCSALQLSGSNVCKDRTWTLGSYVTYISCTDTVLRRMPVFGLLHWEEFYIALLLNS